MSQNFVYNTKVYYEDTDVGGVVYYANYLKFIERARTEMIYHQLNLKHTELKSKYNLIFLVKEIKAKYIHSAKFEDDIKVITQIIKKTAVRLILKQEVYKNDKLLFTAEVELAVVKTDGSIQKIPKNILEKIN
tara:strand:- start:45 stop:443 length:399 start_codon:yes stop_codon:yes gene_type:complete